MLGWRLKRGPGSSLDPSGGGRMSGYRLKETILLGLFATAPIEQSLAADAKVIDISCVEKSDPVVRTGTQTMLVALSRYANDNNPDGAFSISAVGGSDRLFDGAGRLVHPIQLADVVRASPTFVGPKAQRVELGASFTAGGASPNYASRVQSALGIPVHGCSGIAYYLSNGLYLCDSNKGKLAASNFSRELPIGFAPEGLPMFMVFCPAKDQVADPRSVLSAQAAFGLFGDEKESLEKAANSDAISAFRLYQYYWIAVGDRASAMQWLEKAAQLGMAKAQYNLAYEQFESGDAQRMAIATGTIEILLRTDPTIPDLRKFYPNPPVITK